MATPILLNLHGVIGIRLDINVLSIAFWCSILALAAATPARRAHLAQLANQHVQYDVRNMNWIEILALCILLVVIKYSLANARAARRAHRRHIDAIYAEAEEIITRQHARHAEMAGEEAPVHPFRFRRTQVDHN